MDPLLALIRDLYAQVQQLATENAELRKALGETGVADQQGSSDH